MKQVTKKHKEFKKNKKDIEEEKMKKHLKRD